MYYITVMQATTLISPSHLIGNLHAKNLASQLPHTPETTKQSNVRNNARHAATKKVKKIHIIGVNYKYM